MELFLKGASSERGMLSRRHKLKTYIHVGLL